MVIFWFRTFWAPNRSVVHSDCKCTTHRESALNATQLNHCQVIGKVAVSSGGLIVVVDVVVVVWLPQSCQLLALNDSALITIMIQARPCCAANKEESCSLPLLPPTHKHTNTQTHANLAVQRSQVASGRHDKPAQWQICLVATTLARHWRLAIVKFGVTRSHCHVCRACVALTLFGNYFCHCYWQ